MSHRTNEALRKLVHIAFGVFALTLKLIPWWAAAGVAACAVIGNWLLLHRIVGKHIARDERGFDAGIILYPFAVMLLIIVFRDRLHIAAIAWALLAFGDGVATLAGKYLGNSGTSVPREDGDMPRHRGTEVPRYRLPWNPDKSWSGLIAFILAGGLAGIGAGFWMGYRDVGAILIATLAAAITESLALRVDDNVTVPFAAAVALVIMSLQPTLPIGVWPDTVVWLAINGGLAIAGYFARSVNLSGAIGGWLLGAILIFGAGWPMYVALLAFFILGTAATKLGYANKAKAGLAQEGGGRRGFSHAFSNVGVAAICAIAVSRASRVDDDPLQAMTLWYLMGIASLATAAADTCASEIGQLIGRRAFLPLTLKRVPVGTEGAVSIEGTLAGLAGGFLVALAGVATFNYGLPLPEWYPQTATGFDVVVLLVTASAFLGSYLESIAGSWNRKRITPVPNGVLNFFNTAAGALLMSIAWQIAR
jgi:uncharacterized protein (TIGR00297 family)